jgi:hypothetical protein
MLGDAMNRDNELYRIVWTQPYDNWPETQCSVNEEELTELALALFDWEESRAVITRIREL